MYNVDDDDDDDDDSGDGEDDDDDDDDDDNDNGGGGGNDDDDDNNNIRTNKKIGNFEDMRETGSKLCRIALWDCFGNGLLTLFSAQPIVSQFKHSSNVGY